MTNRTRRYETGKMLMDLAKYFATVTGVGSLANERMNWKVAVVGLAMSLVSWVIGVLTIPKDKEVI